MLGTSNHSNHEIFIILLYATSSHQPSPPKLILTLPDGQQSEKNIQKHLSFPYIYAQQTSTKVQSYQALCFLHSLLTFLGRVLLHTSTKNIFLGKILIKSQEGHPFPPKYPSNISFFLYISIFTFTLDLSCMLS